ncbi:hypothetical protein ED21_22468 [Erythrobacter sp. SD-21]|nr:hypothetical protein ED21_22468 [Erythrobacter sp. SD-21]
MLIFVLSGLLVVALNCAKQVTFMGAAIALLNRLVADRVKPTTLQFMVAVVLTGFWLMLGLVCSVCLWASRQSGEVGPTHP